MERIPVMVNGLPGKMATAAAIAVINNERTFLIPYSLTGEEYKGQKAEIQDNNIFLIAPDEIILFGEVKEMFPDMVITDFTTPDAALENAMMYLANGIPFLIGTTGWDTKEVIMKVELGSVPAVIAPNLAFEVIAIMEAFQYIAERFPGLMSSYSLTVTESHQSNKRDVSGTAKKAIKELSPLGHEEKGIISIRDRDAQVEMGIPEEHISGHAYHTYAFTSDKTNTDISIIHNVRGRSIYAEGAVKAAIFLEGKRGIGKVFTGVDVMEER